MDLFELLEKYGRFLLDSKFQSDSSAFGPSSQAAPRSTRLAITTMLEELAPNLWEDDLNRLVDFGHLISPALEMVINQSLLKNGVQVIRSTASVHVLKDILC